MDDPVFHIKADEYEPDLFNDMSVQEEITVGSSDNMLGGYIEHGFPSSSGNSKVNLINSNSVSSQSIDIKSKPQVIYIKSNNNNINNNIRTIKVANNVKQLKVFPLSRLNQDNRIIKLNQSINTGVASLGSNMTRVLNPSMLRNLHITKLNNFNVTKLGGNQKIVFANRSSLTTKFNTVTPINYIQTSNFSPFSQANTIIQPINTHQSNQTALKLEPGDSGFYNLTGGTGPTRYYPRANSPDKDSLDGSQEQMSNVYKTNGLRKYARSVCDKVKEKGTTTYSEVADELVHEYAAEHPMIPPDQLHYIQKNIRRRVYDALNVLMALKVLDKEKKEIKWKGLPVNLLEECKQLEEEKSKKTELLQQRVEELSELVLQLISYKNLVGRNRQKEKEGGAPPMNERIKLPFLVISTNNNTVIDCNISPQKLDYLFTFDQPFEMQDEFQTLKQSGFTLRLGTSQCTESQYKRCLELVPNTLRFYVEAIYQQRSAIVPDFVSLHRRNMAAAAAAQARSTKMGSSSTVGVVAAPHNYTRSSLANTSNHPYWSEPRQSPPLLIHDKRYNAGGNSANWDSVGDSISKYRLSMNPSHNFTTATAGGYQHHELEDDIEVMDEEADFPSD